MKRLMAWMATAATLTFTVPASASQDDPRLVTLFEELKAATDIEQARDVEERIWEIWLVSESDIVNGYMSAGIRAMSLRDPEAALVAFDEVVTIAPEFAEGWNKRATLHYLLGNFEQSVADIQKTLALEPRHFGALSGLGLINLALGRDGKALEAFDAALKIYPLMPGADTHIKALRQKLKGRRT